jgi:CreA protein
LEHDLFAKTGIHPASSAGQAFRDHTLALAFARAAPYIGCGRNGEAGMRHHLFTANRCRWFAAAALALVLSAGITFAARAADEPDLIFRRSTVFKWLTPNDKLATYAIDDPEVEGVACHFTVPERGGVKGWLGIAEEVSDISLACRQIGPIQFKNKFAQGEEMYRRRRSILFKKMQIVRGCDTKRNVLVYVVYSDKLIEGSPKNSTSSVPIMPWGSSEPVPKCADWLEK